MKFSERIIQQKVRHENVSENQFGFMQERSTMGAIYILRRLIERLREKKRDLYMVFIDLEKAYDMIEKALEEKWRLGQIPYDFTPATHPATAR